MGKLYLRRYGTDSQPQKWRIKQYILTFFILFSSLLPWQDAMAGYDTWRRDFCSFYWDAYSGYVKCSARYWTKKGAGSHATGWRSDEGGCKIEVGSPSFANFLIKCTEGGSLSTTQNIPSYTNNDHVISWNYAIDSNHLNETINIHVGGRYWRWGAGYSDDYPNEDYPITTTVNYPVYTIDSVSYINYEGKPAIKISWSSTRPSNGGSWGCFELWEGNQPTSRTFIKEGDQTTKKGWFIFEDVSDEFLKSAKTFKIHQQHNPENGKLHYITNSEDIKLEAYAQPSDLKVTPDINKKTLKVEWSAPQVSGIFNTSKFVLTIKNKSTEKVDTLKYDYSSSKTLYEDIIELGEIDETEFEIGLEREQTFDDKRFSSWNKFRLTQNVVVNTSHCYPDSVTCQKITAEGGDYVKIDWKQLGSIWTKNTQFVIHRTNLTTSTTYDYNLTEDDFRKPPFYDKLIEECNKYKYDLYFTPGGDYSKKTFDIKDPVVSVHIKSLRDLKVSKGYFSDKVDLSWQSTGEFDEFVVERREHDNPQSKYIKIQSVGGLNISDYTVEDRSCQPGIMYAYRVYGLKRCTGTNYSSNDTLYGYGFRTPTGNFYGRIAFENGQSEKNVEVRLESDENLQLYALRFDGAGTAKTITKSALNTGYPLTMQLWVKPDSIVVDTMTLINTANYYKLGIIDGSVFFKVGDNVVVTENKLTAGYNTHVSAVVANDSTIQIYLNGKMVVENKNLSLVNKENNDFIVFGENYKGVIDEVRLWRKSLDSTEINRDYTRYLIGNEDGLDSYYTFDFMSDDEFYDMSHKGTVYNENTGKLYGATKEFSLLSTDQLSYKGYTNEDGQYAINAVPYYGNGTSYTVTPRLGTHQFTPKQEVRFISGDAQSHTVNFTDNSSFEWSGTVLYSGGTFPVEGVHFKIDGVPALNKSGEYILTNADGEFTISVPVGIHEVKAEKDGHTFELDGRICDSEGKDLNYQDMNSGLVLYDNTKVKYIGRICGGEVEENKPVGFSLSKNNLADNMQIVLSPTNTKNFDLQTTPTKENVSHLILSGDKAKGNNVAEKTTEVDYNQKDITIHVNNETGEFVAMVYPIEYKVSLKVNGHKEITGDNSVLDLSKYMVDQYETYEYSDTIKTADKRDSVVSFIDSVVYKQKQVFSKRYRAKMDLIQISGSDNALSYFGDKEYKATSLTGKVSNVPLYVDSTKSYTFGLPVFVTNQTYRMRYNIYEEYPYYISNDKTDPERADRVVINNAEVSFGNKMAASQNVDTTNRIYSFKVSEPEMTTAKGNISATFTYGDSKNPTSVSLENPLGNANGEGFVLGSHQTGTNFVTGGPDKFLCVLRDPPGSKSYSYLEKGTSFTQSSTYTGSFNQEGSESWTTGYKTETMQITTAGLGTQTGTAQMIVNTGSDIKAGIVHEEEYTGSNSKSTSVTLTTRIQTSDDPIYDGANGDVYVGYSTNISFGSTYNVMPVPMFIYDSLGGDKYFDVTYALGDSFAIVKQKGISAVEQFNTMFAYPQIFIEQTLLPNLKDLRNSLLLPKETVDLSKMQELANKNKQNYYVSLVSENDPKYAKEGGYEVYYYYENKDSVKCDTINYLNQAIARWEKALSDNDSVKANAKTLMQNYSFHAGSNVEYSEGYSTTLASNHSFSIKLGVSLNDDYDVQLLGIKSKFEFEETFTTTQGGEFSDEAAASHTKGFVLAEDGDDDYLTVDVLYEDPDFDETYFDNGVGAGSADTSKLNTKDHYPSFVFRTRGGATSCPYEGELKAKHWKADPDKIINVATMKLEDPKINMPVKFIENVPSGEDAYLTVYMMNNSETGEDQWFDLRFVDSRNPYGAVPSIDGNSMSGFALEYLVPAGQVLEKTIAITKGTVLNYDSLAIALCSKCQADPTGFLEVISDTVYFDVHFIPSCTDVAITKPTNNWTYNTNCATDTIDGVEKHYMPITISEFDVNYNDFEHIELQYKEASASDNDWLTLAYYYKDSVLANAAVKNGMNAYAISNDAAGKLYYKFYMDNMPDQKYDLRAVSFCNINNELVENPSAIVSGIKDMYNPRLFGTPKPANGVLTIDDDIRINFNETIQDGVMTANNFEVTGIRNGAVTDHSVAIDLDGENDYLTTEVERNFANKDLTFECWVNFDSLQNATFFSHGAGKNAISMGMNESGYVIANLNGKQIISENVAKWEKSSWNHVALVYNNETQTVTAYVNFVAVIINANVDAYSGVGVVEVGRDVASQSGNFRGKVDQFRIWNDVRSSSTIQVNSTSQLSGNDLNLIAYYDMEEAKGKATEDKARGANLLMKGCSWALPEGRSAEFDGTAYLDMNTSSAVVTSDMDFTLEFWFNAQSGAVNQTILSNGDGINNKSEDASKLFSVGFDSNGSLTFRHNGYETAVEGSFADNDWHNFSLAVNRSSGIARIYIDGDLNTYFSADKIGGIASDKMFAGARVAYEVNDSSIAVKQRKADQYFIGKIDEIRLWNLYRQQSQIENFYNQKVDGDEMGLLLYYPFEHYIEWQGIKEMQFTYEDKGSDIVDAKGNKVVFATSVGNVLGSEVIPPVKNKGAVSKLLYDWVVNNDGLIINLLEQDSRIEKTIVNFTVNKIQDVNGNYITSPITWSAYIDRNQLKWMDDALTINKNENESYSFEMPIVNKGGSVINYTLKNIPSWLSASSKSGVINPLEKQTIEFEIDPSLAVGTYDEVVYLTNSNNVTEPLSLKVTVEGATPEWNVDSKKYEFSMAVFAQIKLDNQFSNDKNDMIAAFYNGECVGKANMNYDKTMDLWYAMLTVYSKDSKSHDLVYRIWDASKGLMFDADSTPAMSFVSDTVYGKPTSPIVFSNGTSMYQNIPLSKGWNWVSFNLKGDMSNLNKYLSSGKWGSNSIVKDLSGKFANYSVNNGKWSNSGVKLNNINMFKIYSDVDQKLSVYGSNIDLASIEIPVSKGSWNYISYLPNYSMTLKAALAGYDATEGDVIKSNDGFAMYYGNEWVGSLKSMQPNCGYMLKNTSGSDKTFKYPSASSSLRSANSAAVNASAYESNMNIIAYASEKEIGDKLRVYVGDEENDVVELAISDVYTLQFINVSANAGDKVRFTMERDGITYEATNQISFVGDAVYGTPDRPYVLNFNMGGMETLTVYPNPVVDVMNVTGSMDGKGDVMLELFDMVGELVYTKQVSVSDNELDANVNLSFLSSGTYVLKVSRGDESKIFKVVKK